MSLSASPINKELHSIEHGLRRMHRVPVSYPVLRRASRQGAGADATFGLEAPASAVLSRELGSCKFDKEGCIVTGASSSLRYPQPRGLHAGLVMVQGTACLRHSSAPIALHRVFDTNCKPPSVCCVLCAMCYVLCAVLKAFRCRLKVQPAPDPLSSLGHRI